MPHICMSFYAIRDKHILREFTICSPFIITAAYSGALADCLQMTVLHLYFGIDSFSHREGTDTSCAKTIHSAIQFQP